MAKNELSVCCVVNMSTMRFSIVFAFALSAIFVSTASAVTCSCNSHVGTQFCYSEVEVSSCDVCNTTSCSGQQTRNCFTGPSINGASASSSCSSSANFNVQNVTYSIVPDGLGELCDQSQCCCLTGSFSASRTPAGALTIDFLSGSLVGKCTGFQLPTSISLSAGGQSYGIVPDFLNMGPTVIQASTASLTIKPVQNLKCFMAANGSSGPGVGAIVGIVIGVLVGLAIVGAIVFFIMRRSQTAGYSQV